MNFQEIINDPEFQSLLNDNWDILADWLMDKNINQLYIDEAKVGGMVCLLKIVDGNGNGSGSGTGSGWGYGCGCGNGSGNGSGSGLGSGSGSGNGD